VVNPRTVNAGIIVPPTGADVDLWGEVDVNPNMVAIDGFISGVQTISVGAVDVTLSVPAGFAATPGPGPTQSQNRVLRFTGALTNDIIITLPLPGVYVIENLTTGAHTMRFRGITATEIVSIDQGDRRSVYNDGANVRFFDLGQIGQIEMWAGISAIPTWVALCTKPPYLLCDGTVYNYSDYPYLGPKLAGKFGGNGITTFAVPDLRGRMAIPYDGTGNRITAAGSGINGQTIGAAADNESVTLTTNQIPSHNHGVNDPGHSHPFRLGTVNVTGTFALQSQNDNQTVSTNTATTGISIQNTGGGQLHTNVQPSQVTGIAVIRAG